MKVYEDGVFGPNHKMVVELLGRAENLTADQAAALSAAWYAAWDAAWDAAWSAARYAAWDAARYAAWDAARHAARYAAWDAARHAARHAALALVVWNLATETGDFTIAQRDLLIAPWVSVMGEINDV